MAAEPQALSAPAASVVALPTRLSVPPIRLTAPASASRLLLLVALSSVSVPPALIVTAAAVPDHAPLAPDKVTVPRLAVSVPVAVAAPVMTKVELPAKVRLVATVPAAMTPEMTVAPPPVIVSVAAVVMVTPPETVSVLPAPRSLTSVLLAAQLRALAAFLSSTLNAPVKVAGSPPKKTEWESALTPVKSRVPSIVPPLKSSQPVAPRVLDRISRPCAIVVLPVYVFAAPAKVSEATGAIWMLTAWPATVPLASAPVTTVEPAPRKFRVLACALRLLKPAFKFNVAPSVSVLASVISLLPASMMTALVNVMDLSPAKTEVALLPRVRGLAVVSAVP